MWKLIQKRDRLERVLALLNILALTLTSLYLIFGNVTICLVICLYLLIVCKYAQLLKVEKKLDKIYDEIASEDGASLERINVNQQLVFFKATDGRLVIGLLSKEVKQLSEEVIPKQLSVEGDMLYYTTVSDKEVFLKSITCVVKILQSVVCTD